MDAASIQERLTDTGLSERELALIIDVLGRNGTVRHAVLFGSRAKGAARPNSDIDLAIEGLQDDLDLARLAMTLDELPLPWRFDVLRFESIASTPLKEHIERLGVVSRSRCNRFSILPVRRFVAFIR
ncbi:MAG: nucleotidyltransferase domain-containing protein [Chlorobiaceae bacterium]|nr:nucleotidyltransferase domain-containing protein [Chlorobiaceae bacterium]